MSSERRYALIGHTHAGGGGGSSTLADLTDTDVTGVATNDMLYYNGADWIDTAGLLTWDGSTFTITGDLSVSGTIDLTGYAQLGTVSQDDNYLYLNRDNAANPTLYAVQIGAGNIAEFGKAASLGSTTFTSSVIITNTGGITATGDLSAVGGTFSGNVGAVNVTGSGTVQGATVTSTGNVNGVAGVFSGAVSGTTGTFTGAVSGTTGTFSGAVTGSNLNVTNWDTAYNDKINSGSFNTSTGDLTLTQQDAGTVVTNLDGRYALSGVGGATQLSELTDVNTSTPTNRNFLIADGVDWESRAAVEADISDLQDYLRADAADFKTSGILRFNDSIALSFGSAYDTSIQWDGVDMEITGLASSQTWNFRDGPHIRIYDDTDVDYLQLDHDGTDFNFTLSGTTDVNWTGAAIYKFDNIIELNEASPRLDFYESDAAADEKRWTVIASNSTFELRTRTDADAAGVSCIRFQRGTGTALTNIDFFDYPLVSYATDYTTTFSEPIANTVQFDISDCGTYYVALSDPDLTGNVTIDFTGYHGSGKTQTWTVVIQQKASSPYTVSWPAEVDWPGGTAPTMSTGASARDVFTFFTVDGGTTVYGTYAQNFS